MDFIFAQHEAVSCTVSCKGYVCEVQILTHFYHKKGDMIMWLCDIAVGYWFKISTGGSAKVSIDKIAAVDEHDPKPYFVRAINEYVMRYQRHRQHITTDDIISVREYKKCWDVAVRQLHYPVTFFKKNYVEL